MPEFDSTTRTKITALRAIKAAGGTVEPYEMVKVLWPEPTGTIWYSCLQVDEVASVPTGLADPIEVRLIPEDRGGSWFLPVDISAGIGDEEVDLNFWDGDGEFADLMIDHGEGVKVILHYWFPQVELLLPFWEGHLRHEEESEIDRTPVKAAQGFRSADATIPKGGHYQECDAIFGGLLSAAEALQNPECDYNAHRSGPIGTNDPATGQPWTYCDRRNHASCTARGVNPLRQLSHFTIASVVFNGQTSGDNLWSTSQGNETNLKDPPRVFMGGRRAYDFKPMAFRKDRNNNDPEHGWFDCQYEIGYGPIAAILYPKFRVDGRWQDMIPLHYAYRLGTLGQSPVWPMLTTHGYSGIASMRFNFGWIDPWTVESNEASGTAIIIGLNDIRVYTDEDTYTQIHTYNRVWQLARFLTDKRWGFGLDYAKLDIPSWIEAAEWAETSVNYTDTFGNVWPHVRSRQDVELVGKKVQQQVEDMCIAGRISPPFLFDGKLHIVPLKALSEEELDACPVFTDTGDDPNIVWEGGRTTLRVGRKSDLDLPNRIEATYDNYLNDHLETPCAPVEDIDAQLRAGRVVGDYSRKVNKKEYKLMGVVIEAHAIKASWGLLDLGPLDQGGLQNNCRVTFKAWFLDCLDLHPYKVIKVPSTRVDKYGFEYFRILTMKRGSNLTVEITAQAYNVEYMNAFETEIADLPPPLGVFGGVGGGVVIGSTVATGGNGTGNIHIVGSGPATGPVISTVRSIGGVLELDIEPAVA